MNELPVPPQIPPVVVTGGGVIGEPPKEEPKQEEPKELDDGE